MQTLGLNLCSCHVKLAFSWVADCGEVFRTFKHVWAHLIPTSPDTSAVLAEHFFNCAASLMARQLRECVENSLNNFLVFLSLYKQGNDYEGTFSDLMFLLSPVRIILSYWILEMQVQTGVLY